VSSADILDLLMTQHSLLMTQYNLLMTQYSG